MAFTTNDLTIGIKDKSKIREIVKPQGLVFRPSLEEFFRMEIQGIKN